MTQQGAGVRLGPAAYQAIFEYSLDGVLFTVPDGRVLAANPAACQLLGRSEDDICAVGRQGLTDHTDARWVDAVAERARTGRTRAQVRMIRGDGSAFEVEMSSATFRTPEGEPRACVIFRDLSERVAAAQQLALMEDRDRIARNLHDTVMRRVSAASMHAHSLLATAADDRQRARVAELVEELDHTLVNVREAVFQLGSESERRYQTLVENSPVSVAVYRGHDTRFVYANHRAVELYGAQDLDDMLSRHARDVVPDDQRPGLRQRVQRVLDGAVIRQARARIVRFDGREIDVEVNATRVVFNGDLCVQMELHDVTKRNAVERRRTKRLEREVRTDALTGVLNRRGWDATVSEAIAGARATASPFAIAVADLDFFKVYNDTHGHPAGDRMLRDLASAWHSQLRKADVLARLGGDEFAIAMPETSLALAEELLHRLSGAVPHGQTCSVGIAQWNGHETGDELLSRADRALYEAKRAGRGQTLLAQDLPAEAVREAGQADQ